MLTAVQAVHQILIHCEGASTFGEGVWGFRNLVQEKPPGQGARGQGDEVPPETHDTLYL